MNWDWSHHFLFVWFCLWLALFEYAFPFDASLLHSLNYFWCDDEIFQMTTKIIFFWIFFLFFGMTKLLWFRRKCLLCSISYIHEINFAKKSDLKYFENQNLFLFFDPDQKCSGCLFSILSIFWDAKIFERMIKKIIFKIKCVFFKKN